MKLGVNLWTIYGWDLPEPIDIQVLEQLPEMGSEGVEIVFDESQNTPERLLERKDELVSGLADLGLDIPAVGTTLFWRYNLASQDAEIRDSGLKTVKAGCRVASAFGARVVLVVAGQQEPETEFVRSYETAVASLRQGAQYAADQGVTLGIESVPGNFLCTPGEYAQFIADVDHPSVGAYLDFGNGASIGSGYPENWITAVRGRIAIVHTKDYDRRAQVFVSCGLGDLQ